MINSFLKFLLKNKVFDTKSINILIFVNLKIFKTQKVWVFRFIFGFLFIFFGFLGLGLGLVFLGFWVWVWVLVRKTQTQTQKPKKSGFRCLLMPKNKPKQPPILANNQMKSVCGDSVEISQERSLQKIFNETKNLSHRL